MALGISMRAAPGACAAVSWVRGLFRRARLLGCSAPTAYGPAFAPARRRALQGQGLGARGTTHQSSRRRRNSSYGCRIPAEVSTPGESGFRDRARGDGHQFAPSPRPTETTTTILRRGLGIPLLDEPLEDLVHVHDFESRDRNHDPGVLRDVVQVQVSDQVGLADVRFQIDLVHDH